MAYWKLNYNYLDYINFSWKDYYDERMWALDSLYRHAEEAYRDEGNEDIRLGRYTRASVQKWYDDKVKELKYWYNSCVDELNEDNRKFKILYNQMVQYKYDSNFFHYEIVYDFRKFTRTVNYSSTLDSMHFRVKVLGVTHWYEVCGRKEEMSFAPESPVPKNADVFY